MKIVHYTFDKQEEYASNLVPTIDSTQSINTYPTTGNGWGTYNTNQYNGGSFFSIGTVDNVTNNIVTLSVVSRTLFTYDVLRPQTSGGGVTANTDYFIKKWASNQFSLHAYNGSQDGSQGYWDGTNYAVYSSISTDTRIAINASGFPTMWWGAPHVPNAALVKEVIPNGCRGHNCLRLHTDHRTGFGAEVDGLAYDIYPQVNNGVVYTWSFLFRAANAVSIGANITYQTYTAGVWASGSVYATMNWQKATMTGTSNGTGGAILYIFPNTEGKMIDIAEIQIEANDHATPFTLLTRTPILGDSSEYGHHGILNSSQPKWVGTSNIRGSGSFYFNGSSQYFNISIPSSVLSTLTNCTVTFYRKSSTSPNWLLLMGQAGNYYLMASASGNGNFYHGNAGSPTIYRDGVSATAPLSDGAWHHYAAVGVNLSTWTSMNIGNYGGFRYNEYLDDFRIYSTAFSQAEVQAIM